MINFWGLISTVIIYEIAKYLHKFKLFKHIHPNVIAGLTLIAVLNIFKLNYISYNESACFLTLLLGPATVALAFPLCENIELLTKNKRAIYFGFFTGTFTALFLSFIIGKLFHADWNIILTLMPKSVTTPIALEISKAIGGIPELTACIVCITGVYGALFGHKLLKLVHVKSDISIGLAIGAASHVLGTSSCIEEKRPKQVVMATLALIIIGIITTVICISIF